MLPNSKIIIKKGGDHRVEGMEKSDQCYKLLDIAREAGKVIEEKKKDHVPIYQTINIKGE